MRTATEPIPVGDDGSLPDDLADLIKDLYDTMDAANGVGLAANQIGVSKRVFVYDCADARGRTSRVSSARRERSRGEPYSIPADEISRPGTSYP